MTSQHLADILIVDDSVDNAELIGLMLQSDGYAVRQAYSGDQALRAVACKAPDLILMDIVMPGINGIDVTREIKKSDASRHIPIILLSGRSDEQSRLNGLNAGAEDCLTKPLIKRELLFRVRNLLRLKNDHDTLDQQKLRLESEVKLRNEQLEASYQETLYMLVHAVERRDPRLGSHVERIREYCKAIAAAMGLDHEFQKKIYHASALYDIGKIGIPDRILLKRTPLTPRERTIMETHTTIGAQLLKEGKSDYLRMAAEVANFHHEKWDGTGYPAGLAGEAIPLAARIMMICDTYDALRSDRTYKAASSHGNATEILLLGDDKTRPGHFDPAVLDAFMSQEQEFSRIYNSHMEIGHAMSA